MENKGFVLKVVQVLGGAEDGGLEKHTIELSHLLKEKGIEISVIAHKKFKKDFINVNFIECDLSKNRNNPFILFKLYKLLRKGDFDIIHTQASKATDMVIKLKPFLKSKIVSTLHNYKKNINCFEKSDFVITVSDKIGENLKNTNKITIYNGIKIENINKIDLYKKFNIPVNSFLVCSIGRFVNVKRFDILIESVKKAGKDVYLILIGDGYKKEELVRNSNERIIFTGYLNQKETKEILKSSHLFIMTSQREGFPYTFVESMFCKTPFISTPVSDIEKFVTKKYIVQFEDIEGIANKILYIKNNYESILNDFIPIFKFAQNEFSLNKMVDRTIKIYQKVLKSECIDY